MKKLLIANWKMKMLAKPALEFVRQVKNKPIKGFEVVIAPSMPHLESVNKALGKSTVNLAAQNVAAWDQGSFTGETSAKMLKDAGCKYAIVGHSERRQLLQETNEMVNEKIKQLYAVNLSPILCIGESAKEKDAGKRDMILTHQIRDGLKKIPDLEKKKLIVAYEPIWAIGSGHVCTPKELESAYRVIKRAVTMTTTGRFWDDKVRFIYGGSVTASNAWEFWQEPYLQGFLVGGASLKVKDFLPIAQLS